MRSLRGGRAWVLALPLSLGLVACGGGGSASPESLLGGPYQYVQLTGAPGTKTVRSETGQLTSDGAGTLTFGSAWAATEGAVEGPVVPLPRTYTVAGDRRLTVLNAVQEAVSGRVTADGGFAALSAETEGTPPVLLLLARRMVDPAPADLAGSWIFLQWYRSSDAAAHAGSGFGEVTVDNAGGVAVGSYTYNLDGALDPNPTFFPPQEIVPGGGGWLEWRSVPGGTVWHRGGLSDDGNLLIFGGDLGASGYAVARVLVRAGLAASVAQVAGAYASAGFGPIGPQPPSSVSFWGSLALNGSGTGSWDLWGNDGMVVKKFPVLSVTYSVASDGTTDVNLAGSTPYRGVTGPGGDYVVLGGGASPGGSPWIHAIVR